MPDTPQVRLGRKRYVRDRRTLRFARYVTPQLPVAPDSFDVTENIGAWNMLANDRLGDCTAAGAAHLEMVWSRIAGSSIDPSESDVIDFYRRVTNPPYDPATGANDDGAVELFVCQEWRANGIAGRRIHAYVYVEPKQLDQLHQASWLFAGSYLGVALPITAQSQDVWDDTGEQTPNAEPGSWGGHCVVVVGRDKAAGRWTIVTWGQLKQVTDAFMLRYCEEAWVMVPEDFATLSGPNAASGFDFDTLNADLAALGSVNPGNEEVKQ
jgi:hypothetical protein